uniref:Dual-specificity kinase n=1 Tax=Panagrolaimus sp. PS1159 TaxID=55785 RepID=A0AC35FT94_9BILA
MMEVDNAEIITILDDISTTSTSTSSSSRSSSTVPHYEQQIITTTAKSRPVAKGFTAVEALHIYRNNLTKFEQNEILTFSRVYFTGNLTQKLQPENPGPGGFDDAKGSYRFILHDHLGYRYEIYKPLGSGSFGQVYNCFDHKRKNSVAVKIVRSTPKVAQSAQIEGDILLHLNSVNGRGSNNIIKLLNYFEFRGHQCVVFELMGLSLYDILKKRKFKGLTCSQVKPIATEVLLALNFLKEQKVVHCDLKPENILLSCDSSDRIKLIDFGSACYEGKSCYTYIQSRFYRAPEVLLNATFGSAIDMWSFGCIVYELIVGYPLFPGENRNDQLSVIMELKGLPPASLIARGKASADYFRNGGQPRYCQPTKLPDGTTTYVPNKSPKGNARFKPGEKTWDTVLKTRIEPKLVSFLSKCLEYEPPKRYLPIQALIDPWIKDPPEIITID